MSQLTAWAVHCKHFGICVEFLHFHGEGMDSRATDAAKAIRIFERLRDLVLSHKVLELCAGFTPKDLLKTATTGLANAHFLAIRHMGLEGVGAAVHLVENKSSLLVSECVCAVFAELAKTRTLCVQVSSWCASKPVTVLLSS